MSKDPTAISRRNSVFLPADQRKDAHIVDVLIEERCPSFVSHWSWPVLRPALYAILGYHRARKMADFIQSMDGWETFDYLVQELKIKVVTQHLERVPQSGRLIIAVNHPTGLADGPAVWEAVTAIRRDCIFLANADAMRVHSRLEDTIIPVEWVLSKRSPAKARETLRQASQAFEREACLVIFPSGKPAQKRDGKITEQDWYPTVVSLARKQNAPILPLHIDAKNSWVYYLFAWLSGELRDITLFRELLNKRGERFELVFGPLIAPDKLTGDATQITEQLKRYVSYDLKDQPDLIFEPDL